MKYIYIYMISCLIQDIVLYDLFKQFCPLLGLLLDKSQKIGEFDKFHCPGPRPVMMMG